MTKKDSDTRRTHVFALIMAVCLFDHNNLGVSRLCWGETIDVEVHYRLRNILSYISPALNHLRCLPSLGRHTSYV